MSWKSNLSPESRIRLLGALGPLSGLAFVLSIFLERLQDPNLDFISGFLIGFSIVGNLAYIYVITRYMRNK
jgi:hypothetical protein